MDSEQLVSNPFQDMKEEAVDNAKKVSLTEKLTSVKNNVCENHLVLKNTKLQKDISHRLKQIHDTASQLRYEAKVYDINRRKTELENRKRYDPYKDYTYDEMQLHNNTKRLGVVVNCHYLNKKQQYPLRGRTVNDLNPNATVRQARQIYHRREQQSRQLESRGDILSTPRTIGSGKSGKSRLLCRRNSKSAPPMSKSLDLDDRSTKLPSLGNKSAGRVKFAPENPILSFTPEKLERAKTFHPGMMNRRASQAWQKANKDDEDLEDEDDDIDIEKLRSVIFGDKYSNSIKSGCDTPRTMTSFQSSTATSRRPTEEELKREQLQLKRKIDDFFGNLQTGDYDSDISMEDIEETPALPPPPSKANLMLNIFARSVPKMKKLTETAVKNNADIENKEAERSKSVCSQRSKSPNTKTVQSEPKKRDLWKYIKTSVQRGEIKRCQTPSKLIIEQMTHLDLTDSEQKHIPLKSANRALRHTPTFKMRQLVERMQRERTKYEQFEIDQMKNQLQEGQKEGIEIMAL